MLTGSCHCGAVTWTYDATPDGVTSCNCTVCRRYGTLWIYGHEGVDVSVAGKTTAYARGGGLTFNFCPTCGAVAFWRGLIADETGQPRMAVNLRLADSPDEVMDLPIDRFEGLESFEDLPRDGRTVRDMWF